MINPANTRTFLASSSELSDRFDPTIILYNRKVRSFKYPAVPLKSVLLKQPQYGANESGIERTSLQEPRYIRITDIDEFGLLNNSLGVTAEKIEEKYFLENNDILFARSGATVGKAYIHKSANVNYPCFFAGYMIRCIVDDTIMLPDYLFAYTQLDSYKEWVKAIQRAAGQPNINAEEYKSLKLPLPPLEIQRAIVQKITAAYLIKQEKESQAQHLLSTIEAYILKNLGLTLPERRMDLSGRVFSTTFKEVAGIRLDPWYFKTKHTIESPLFPNNPLWRIASLTKGQSITRQQITPGDYPVIAGGQSSPYSHSEFNFQGNVITISASGAYSGFVWYHDYPIFASDCIVAQSHDERVVSTKFIYYVLKVLQSEIYKMQQGAGQPHVYAKDVEKITIPTPSLAIQQKMLEHIHNQEKQVNSLKAEAVENLAGVKQEIEGLLIAKGNTS